MEDLIATTFDHAQCSLFVLGLSHFYMPSKSISQAMSTSSLWCDLVGFLVVVFESFNSTNARRLIWLLGPPTVPLMHEWDLRTLHQPDAFGERNETQVPLRSISGSCITRYMHANYMCCFPNCKSLLWMFILWDFSGLSGKKSEFPTCFKSLVLAKAWAILWMAQDPKKNREFANVHSQYYWQYSRLYVNMQTHTLQIEVLIQKCSYLIPDLHELT